MIAIGLQLMVIGMAVVFLFLTLLVTVLKVMGHIMMKMGPEEAQGGQDERDRDIAIALAAVSSYQTKQAR